MRSPIDVAELLWKRLNVDSSLKEMISGGIYYKRPANSGKEDVVIVPLVLTATQLQKGVINVNVYVKNLELNIGGKPDPTQYNGPRLKVITDKVIAMVDDQWGDDYNFSVQQMQGPLESENGQHFMNIRVEFNAVNI